MKALIGGEREIRERHESVDRDQRSIDKVAHHDRATLLSTTAALRSRVGELEKERDKLADDHRVCMIGLVNEQRRASDYRSKARALQSDLEQMRKTLEKVEQAKAYAEEEPSVMVTALIGVSAIARNALALAHVPHTGESL